MKLAYITTYDAADIHNWSGIGFTLAQALEKQSLSLQYIGSLREKHSLLYKSKQLAYRMINQKHLRDREPGIAQDYARQIKSRLAGSDIDVVFSPGSIPISYLECDKPMVFWTDATFAGMLDFYPNFTNLSKQSIIYGNRLEKMALDKCALAVYCSDWAAQTAVELYNVDPKKVKVISFGPIIDCNRQPGDIKNIIAARSSAKCKLLFIGVDWKRKGGDKALELARMLNQRGLETELNIVGCRPETSEPLPEYVNCLGFVSKSTLEGRNVLDKLLAESTFFIMPSQAECFGLVYCEAASFGLPSLAVDVGGVSSAVKNDISGRLFSQEAGVEEYCNYILDLFNNYSDYVGLSLSSFTEYQQRLNWEVAGQKFKQLLEDYFYRF